MPNPFSQQGAAASGEGAAERAAPEHDLFAGLEEEPGSGDPAPEGEPGAREGEGAEGGESERVKRLFGGDDEGEEAEGGEEEEGEGSEGKPRGEPSLHKRGRFKAMRRQRDEARQTAQTAQTALQEAEAKVRPLQEFFEKHYSWAEDPIREAIFSTRVTDFLAELHQSGDRDAVSVTEKIMAKIGGARAGADAPRSPAAAAEPKESGPDKTTLKVAERQVRGDLRELLTEAEIEPRFQKMIVQHVLDSSKGKVADLDEDALVELVQGWIAKSGFTREELRGGAAKGSSRSGRTRVPSGSGRAGAASRQQQQRGGEGSDDDGERKAPKSFAAWQAQKAKARDAMFANLGRVSTPS